MQPGDERIVVGVDGSRPAEAALEWAADEARRRSATLEVVTVWEAPAAYGGGAVATVTTSAAREPAEARARKIAESAARRAEQIGARAVPRAIEGQVSGVLADLSEHADLLVVGSRGRGGFSSLLLGSVSAQCAHHARAPLVIVR